MYSDSTRKLFIVNLFSYNLLHYKIPDSVRRSELSGVVPFSSQTLQHDAANFEYERPYRAHRDAHKLSPRASKFSHSTENENAKTVNANANANKENRSLTVVSELCNS